MRDYAPFFIGAALGVIHLIVIIVRRPVPINYPFQGLAFAALMGSLIVGWPLYFAFWGLGLLSR